MSAARMLGCAGHGEQPWDGETVCALEEGGCGRLQRVRAAASISVCCAATAGAVLDGEPSRTLRAVCPKCFDAYGGEGGSTAS